MLIFLVLFLNISTSIFAITGGIDISNEAIPAVIQLNEVETGGKCSGTFIEPNKILTAAHCAFDMQFIFNITQYLKNLKLYPELEFEYERNRTYVNRKITIVNKADINITNIDYLYCLNDKNKFCVFRHGDDVEIKSNDLNLYVDYAVITTDKKNKEYIPIATKNSVKKGDKIHFVGYGVDNFTKSRSIYSDFNQLPKNSRKRLGSNTISEIDNNVISIDNLIQMPGGKTIDASVLKGSNYEKIESLTNHGDSGGPIFNNNGEVVAIITHINNVDIVENNISYSMLVTHEFFQSVFKNSLSFKTNAQKKKRNTNTITEIEKIIKKYKDTFQLIAAIEKNDEYKYQELLQNNDLDINNSLNGGKTPLIAAAENNNAELVQTLLEIGSNVNHKDDKGYTALMKASMHQGADQIVTLLLQAGSDIDAANKFGQTALMLADEKGYCNIVDLLIAN